MRVFWICLAVLIGAAIGLFLGTVGFFYGCMLYDKIAYPNGVPTGGGLTAVGWIFVFFTAPAGTVLGGAAGALCLLWKWRSSENKLKQD